MTRIEVDVDAARSVAGRLASAAGPDACTGGLAPDPGALGPVLTDVVADWSQRWGWAGDAVRTDVQGAAQALRDAVTEFQRVDTALCLPDRPGPGR